MANPKRKPLPALTGIRIFLALWVVLLHLHSANPAFGAFITAQPRFIRNIVGSGASAVGVFFLLSGFVLAYNYDLASSWSAAACRKFWLARFARIYPIYLFALILGIPSLLAGLVKSDLLHPHIVLLAAGLTLTLLQSWVPGYTGLWGGPAWSLSVEAFFYLTFPLLGRLLWRLERRRLQLIAILLCWIAACTTAYTIAAFKAPSLLTQTIGPETFWSAVLKFDPLVRLPEFLAGIVLCKLYLTLERRPSFGLRAGSGAPLYLLGLTVAALVVSFQQLFPPAILHDGFLIPATAAIILGLSFGGGPLCRWLSAPLPVFLGQASYSVYVIHMALYSYFAAAARRLVHTPAQNWAVLALYIITLIALSSLLFTKIEEPARRAILRRFGAQRATQARQTEPVAADPF